MVARKKTVDKLPADASVSAQPPNLPLADKHSAELQKAGARKRANVVPEDGIGKQLREAREARGWTQSVLSVRTRMSDPQSVGISRTVIVGYEAGRYKPGAREIRVLCEALGITPNWLLYRKEAPFETVQASMRFLSAKNEFDTAFRLAFAALLLKPHERDLIASLILSLGGRELGDLRLSGLLATAQFLGDEVKAELQERYPILAESGEGVGIDQVLDEMSRGFVTNWGNKLDIDVENEGQVVGGDWLYPDPKK